MFYAINTFYQRCCLSKKVVNLFFTNQFSCRNSIRQYVGFYSNNYNRCLRRNYQIIQANGKLIVVHFCSDLNKKSFEVTNAVKLRDRGELIKNVLEKKRGEFIEKKNILVKDIQVKKSKVKEKMREKVEEVIERENILTIPNFLTVGRGLLAPYLGYIIVQGDFTLAMGLLVVAGISDLLDGQIARYWPKQASKFGSFLDPLADKLLVGSLVISMGYCDLLPVWLSGMILFRDASLIVAGFVIRYISLPAPKTLSRYFDATHVTAQLEPTFISKVNTAVQLLTIGLSLGAPIWNYTDHVVLHGLWYLTGATTAAAAVSYITSKNTFKIMRKPIKIKQS